MNEGNYVKQLQLSQPPHSRSSVDGMDVSIDAAHPSPNGLSSDHLDIGATQEVPSCGSTPVSGLAGHDPNNDVANTCAGMGTTHYLTDVGDGSNIGSGATIIRRITAGPAHRHLIGHSGAFHSHHSYTPGFTNFGMLSGTQNNQAGLPVATGQVPFLPDVMEPELHQLGVRIQHLNIRVKDAIVTNPNGCCVYFGRYDEINSPAAPDPIEAQIPHHVSEANKAYVDLLLDNMVRGIILSATHGSIYVQRMCKCAVFIYIPMPENENVFFRKLGRREREKIFDYEQFMVDLECYRAGQQPRPHFEVILAFGQQLRPGLSTDGLLVWCRVASCRAWFHLHKLRSMVPIGSLADSLSESVSIVGASGVTDNVDMLNSHLMLPHPTSQMGDTFANGSRAHLHQHHPSHRFVPDHNNITGGNPVIPLNSQSLSDMPNRASNSLLVVRANGASRLQQHQQRFRLKIDAGSPDGGSVGVNVGGASRILTKIDDGRNGGSASLEGRTDGDGEEDDKDDDDLVSSGVHHESDLPEDDDQIQDGLILVGGGTAAGDGSGYMIPTEQVVIEEGVEVPLDDDDTHERGDMGVYHLHPHHEHDLSISVHQPGNGSVQHLTDQDPNDPGEDNPVHYLCKMERHERAHVGCVLRDVDDEDDDDHEEHEEVLHKVRMGESSNGNTLFSFSHNGASVKRAGAESLEDDSGEEELVPGFSHI